MKKAELLAPAGNMAGITCTSRKYGSLDCGCTSWM